MLQGTWTSPIVVLLLLEQAQARRLLSMTACPSTQDPVQSGSRKKPYKLYAVSVTGYGQTSHLTEMTKNDPDNNN